MLAFQLHGQLSGTREALKDFSGISMTLWRDAERQRISASAMDSRDHRDQPSKSELKDILRFLKNKTKLKI